MIFIDTNVFMYALGSHHSLQEAARQFFRESHQTNTQLFTSAEVLQELLHVYLRAGRMYDLDKAFDLIERYGIEVWPLAREDVELARQLADRYPYLGSRDNCHLASCRNRGVTEIKTFDRGLDSVAASL